MCTIQSLKKNVVDTLNRKQDQGVDRFYTKRGTEDSGEYNGMEEDDHKIKQLTLKLGEKNKPRRAREHINPSTLS